MQKILGMNGNQLSKRQLNTAISALFSRSLSRQTDSLCYIDDPRPTGKKPSWLWVCCWTTCYGVLVQEHHPYTLQHENEGLCHCNNRTTHCPHTSEATNLPLTCIASALISYILRPFCYQEFTLQVWQPGVKPRIFRLMKRWPSPRSFALSSSAIFCAANKRWCLVLYLDIRRDSFIRLRTISSATGSYT